MFYHVLLLLLWPLYVLIGRLLRDDRDREIVTLCQQVSIMRGKPGRPRSITPEMEQRVLRIARENPRVGLHEDRT